MSGAAPPAAGCGRRSRPGSGPSLYLGSGGAPAGDWLGAAPGAGELGARVLWPWPLVDDRPGAPLPERANGGYWLIDWLIVAVVLIAVVRRDPLAPPVVSRLRGGQPADALANPFPDRPLMSMPRFVLLPCSRPSGGWRAASSGGGSPEAAAASRASPPASALLARAVRQLVLHLLSPGASGRRLGLRYRMGSRPSGRGGGSVTIKVAHRGRPLARAPRPSPVPGHGRRASRSSARPPTARSSWTWSSRATTRTSRWWTSGCPRWTASRRPGRSATASPRSA